MTFLPVGGFPLSGAINLNVPGVPARINFDYFLDREDVIAKLGVLKAKALRKAGYKVMQTARRSIKKMGMAKPKLREMKDRPGVSLRDLLNDPEIPEARKRVIGRRLLEIQAKTPSLPGTPPHTHKGVLRRDIVFAYDPIAESVVVGSFMRGGAWLASLHEFGGREQMRGWAWIPKYPRTYRAGIIGYWRTDRSPRNRDRWEPTNFIEMHDYPKRSYMRPAIEKCAANGDVVNSFKVGGLGN
jgi:hypothetical protein